MNTISQIKREEWEIVEYYDDIYMISPLIPYEDRNVWIWFDRQGKLLGEYNWTDFKGGFK